MNKVLFLFRGLPGAGKTTAAELLFTKVLSADDYFMVNGEYVFNASKLRAAHEYCQSSCDEMMIDGTNAIAVANTFTTESEMAPYFNMAEHHGYNVITFIVENRHGNKSVHNVPDETVAKMNDRFVVAL